MTAPEKAPAQAQQQVEERRPPIAVVALGLLAVALLFFAGAVGGGLGGAAGAAAAYRERRALPLAVWVGWNGTQKFGLVVPPGSFVYDNVLVCNVGEGDVLVEARVVNAPRDVRVFALWLGDRWFGVRWGNSTELRRVFARGECVRARVEVLVDALSKNSTHVVVVEFVSYPLER
ncbi:MAG: hypothetical protein QW452_05560 [Pyrobaculum sp.]